ncbi:sulfotransferase 2A6-like [Marmota flaviventris]|uniref:sulfotransferase 2A6-like n=1 Tax=Marmota flaviventris TaxID=93162 RepID=UPI003A874663
MHHQPNKNLSQRTQWLIEIVCLIHSRGDPKWVQSVPFWKRSPWIERRDAEQLDRDSEDPRFFTSHLPFHLFPKSFFTFKGKVIYIIRNPRDALVSGYFFWSRTNFVKNPDSLEQFFEQFIQGNGTCGDWKNHFTVAQADAFDKLYQEKMKGFPEGLFPWE